MSRQLVVQLYAQAGGPLEPEDVLPEFHELPADAPPAPATKLSLSRLCRLQGGKCNSLQRGHLSPSQGLDWHKSGLYIPGCQAPAADASAGGDASASWSAADGMEYNIR